MTTTEIILIIVSIAFLLFIGFCIPILLQLRRAVKKMDETLHVLNEGLPPIIRNLAEITTNVNRTTVNVHRQVAELSSTLSKIQGAVGIFVGLEEVIRRRVGFPFVRKVATLLSVARGVSAFVHTLSGPRSAPRQTKAELPR